MNGRKHPKTLPVKEFLSRASDDEKNAKSILRHKDGTRYPADIALEVFNWEKANEALESALAVKRFVSRKMTQTE